MDARVVSAQQQRRTRSLQPDVRPATAQNTKEQLPGSRQAAGLLLQPRQDTAPFARAGQTSSAPFAGHGKAGDVRDARGPKQICSQDLVPARYCVHCRGDHHGGACKDPYGPKQRLYGLCQDATEFARLYSSGAALPCKLDTYEVIWKNKAWPGGGYFELARWLPVFADGVREPEPRRQLAVLGFVAMLGAGEAALLPLLPEVIRSLRTGMNCGDLPTVAQILHCLCSLLRAGPGVAREIVRLDLLRRLLPVLNLLKDSSASVRVGYCKEITKRWRMADVVEETLRLLEGGGIKGAAFVIADYVRPCRR